MPSQPSGSEGGIVMFGAEIWTRNFNSLVTVNTSALYQRTGNWGNGRKTRLMSSQGGGGVLCPYKTFTAIWIQTGQSKV
jgi:hypothetical protein